MTIFTKAKSLFKNKDFSHLINKTTSYTHFLILSFWCKITFKESSGELKASNKNWVYYTFLKSKYKKFLKNYQKKENSIHEYSDIIWWCWFQGEENAPEIAKKCLESLRRNMPSKKIIVITDKNMFDYVKFPEFIMEKYKKGYISKTHLSDLLRLELLINYGGTWIDATCYCTKSPDYAFNIPLFAFKTNERGNPATAAQNWFIASEKQNPILLLTRDLLYNYWKSYNSAIHYFIFYFFFKLATEKYSEEWKNVPWYPDLPPHIMQRELFDKFSEHRLNELKRFSDIHKLSYKLDFSKNTENSIYEKYIKKMPQN